MANKLHQHQHQPSFSFDMDMGMDADMDMEDTSKKMKPGNGKNAFYAAELLGAKDMLLQKHTINIIRKSILCSQKVCDVKKSEERNKQTNLYRSPYNALISIAVLFLDRKK